MSKETDMDVEQRERYNRSKCSRQRPLKNAVQVFWLPLLLLAVACQGTDAETVRTEDVVPLSPTPVVVAEPTAANPTEIGYQTPSDSRPVFDLIANRHLAHRIVGDGLRIDAGGPGFARYAHGNRSRDWNLNAEEDSAAVALPRRREPLIAFPLTASQADAAEVIEVGFWYGSGRNTWRLELEDGTSLGDHDGHEGWQEAQFEVSPGQLVAGENTLRLKVPRDGTRTGSRTRSALSYIYVGPRRHADATNFDDSFVSDGSSMNLSPNQGLSYYLVLPPSAFLELELEQLAEPNSGCRLDLSADDEWGNTISFGQALTADRMNLTTGFSLAALPVGEVVRLEMRLSSACAELRIQRAELRREETILVQPEVAPPRNVIVWLIDTLRADRLTSINPGTRVQTPTLDRLAAEGAVFTRAYVQGNESFASHAALFAGRYPVSTGVFSSSDHLGNDEVLITELARDAGLRTGGYSSNGHIRSTNGFEQGFSFFINTLRDNYRYLAPGLTRHASNWVDEHGDEPFYLYIGTVDAHVTYRSHEDILPLYDPEPYDGQFRRSVGGDELGQIKAGSLRVNARDRQRIEAIYDDEVTFGDRHFGVFLEHLEAAGLLDETLIIVTSDHGDEFWEHDSVGHGHNVYQELVHVPLLMRYPAGIPAGTVIEQGVDTIDILPTIADMLGQEVPERAQGESLLPLIHGIGSDYPRPAYSQMRGFRHTMALDRWKVIWRDGGGRNLYDLVSDPSEQVDVAADRPYALRFVSDAMGLFMAYRRDWNKREWGVASNLLPGFVP